MFTICNLHLAFTFQQVEKPEQQERERERDKTSTEERSDIKQSNET